MMKEAKEGRKGKRGKVQDVTTRKKNLETPGEYATDNYSRNESVCVSGAKGEDA